MVSSGSLWRLRFSTILSPGAPSRFGSGRSRGFVSHCPTGRGARSANGGFRSLTV